MLPCAHACNFDDVNVAKSSSARSKRTPLKLDECYRETTQTLNLATDRLFVVHTLKLSYGGNWLRRPIPQPVWPNSLWVLANTRFKIRKPTSRITITADRNRHAKDRVGFMAPAAAATFCNQRTCKPFSWGYHNGSTIVWWWRKRGKQHSSRAVEKTRLIYGVLAAFYGVSLGRSCCFKLFVLTPKN